MAAHRLLAITIVALSLLCFAMPSAQAKRDRALGYEFNYSFNHQGVKFNLTGESMDDELGDFFYRYPYRHHREDPSYYRPYQYDDNYYYGQGGYWRWVQNGYMPYGAVISGYEQNQPIYYCRAPYRHSIYYGKTRGNICYIKYRDQDLAIYHYKVLVK